MLFNYFLIIFLFFFISSSLSFTIRQPFSIKSSISSIKLKDSASSSSSSTNRISLTSLIRTIDTELNKDVSVEKDIKYFLHKIQDEVMKNDKEIVIQNFGKFKKVKREARNGRNPLTGETISIPESYTMKFYSSNKNKISN